MQDIEISLNIKTLVDDFRERNAKSSFRWGCGGLVLAIIVTPVFTMPFFVVVKVSAAVFAVSFVLFGYGVYLIPVGIGRLIVKRRTRAAARHFEQAFPKDTELFDRALEHLIGFYPQHGGGGFGEVGRAAYRRYRREKRQFDRLLGLLGAEAPAVSKAEDKDKDKDQSPEVTFDDEVPQ